MAWYDRFQRRPKRRKVLNLRKYQGANTGRLFADFTQTSTSADEEIKNNLRLLRDRSRDLARNDSYVQIKSFLPFKSFIFDIAEDVKGTPLFCSGLLGIYA